MRKIITVQVKFFTKPIVILHDPYPLPKWERKRGTKGQRHKKDTPQPPFLLFLNNLLPSGEKIMMRGNNKIHP